MRKTGKREWGRGTKNRCFLFFAAILAAAPFFFFPGCSRSQKEAPVIAETAIEQAVENKVLLAALVSVGSVPNSAAGQAVTLEAEAKQTPRIAVIPPSAEPGAPVTVALAFAMVIDNSEAPKDIRAVLLDSRNRRLTRAAFFKVPDDEEKALFAAVFAVPSTALSGSATIRIESGDDLLMELPFTIDMREFQSETVHLNQANTDLRTLPDPQKTAESEQLWAILNRTGREIYSGGIFTAPLISTRRTSDYGSRRVYQYANGKSDTTIHAGVDYGVPTGTAVTSCASGRVILARERIVTGNTVILEHLPGVYSLYYHMDSIAVSEGGIVPAGALLGESGSTGLATGPHLHWEIRVAGENADPDVFLSRPVLDKKDIINKLK